MTVYFRALKYKLRNNRGTKGVGYSLEGAVGEGRGISKMTLEMGGTGVGLPEGKALEEGHKRPSRAGL